MLQREVADRLVSPPGGRDYGVLSVLMQHVAAIDLRLKLPAGAFRPPPTVLSSLVRLRFHAPDPPVADPIAFASLVQAVFTRRRKTLSNALLAHTDAARAAPALAAADLDGTRRPETVSVADFVRLANALK
jgi:16S rRNA (adenine1518-N6/adenine1519-N6)-dimethyltransferase